jgi:hypothetical protein
MLYRPIGFVFRLALKGAKSQYQHPWILTNFQGNMPAISPKNGHFHPFWVGLPIYMRQRKCPALHRYYVEAWTKEPLGSG